MVTAHLKVQDGKALSAFSFSLPFANSILWENALLFRERSDLEIKSFCIQGLSSCKAIPRAPITPLTVKF